LFSICGKVVSAAKALTMPMPGEIDTAIPELLVVSSAATVQPEIEPLPKTL
tara:strand:- start:284 stop:436 length:153 start_codon:yes stop_codon:yes gene_type:complete